MPGSRVRRRASGSVYCTQSAIDVLYTGVQLLYKQWNLYLVQGSNGPWTILQLFSIMSTLVSVISLFVTNGIRLSYTLEYILYGLGLLQ